MSKPSGGRVLGEPGLRGFLDRAVAVVEYGGLAALLVLTLAQPADGRLGIPTWALVVLAAVLLLAFDLARIRVPRLRSYRLKYALDLPASALIYALGAEPGGPLFVLFFVGVVCAAATLTLRDSLAYTAAAAGLMAAVDLALPTGGDGGLMGLGSRVILLALFGANTAVLARRVALEREAARSARGASERLGELDRLRERFVSSVSHNLKTPLTATRAGLGLLEESARGRLRPGERELLENARRNTARLGMIVDDLLAYNRLEAGTLRLEREPLDLRAVAGEAVSSLDPLLREKGQTLEMDLPAALPVEGDSRLLEQVVVNLLENAHLHTPQGTRVLLVGRTSDSEASLTVSDDGPGIPEAEMEAVFRRFHRLETEEGGSGIGLAITRSIVEMHGGRVWAENRPGGGASFVVVLPVKSGVG